MDDKLFNVIVKQRCPVCYEEPLNHKPKELLEHYGHDFFQAFIEWFLKQQKVGSV